MVLQRGLEPRRSLSLRARLRRSFRFAQKRFAFGVRGFESSVIVEKQADKPAACLPVFGAPAGTRTPDTLLKRQVLYLLSYWGGSVFSHPCRRMDRFFFFAAMLAQGSSPSQIKTQRSGFDLEKEGGSCGYRAFAASLDRRAFLARRHAPSQTAEAAWSSFLLTLWLGWRDSNPLYRSQSPVCYHYTTSQNAFCEKRPALPAFPRSVGWDMGLEPTTPGTTIRCSSN